MRCCSRSTPRRPRPTTSRPAPQALEGRRPGPTTSEPPRRYLADTVLRHELDEVREKLRGRVISDGDLRRAGVSLAQKNAVGRHVSALVGARDLYAVIRQGRVNENDHAVEDLLVCDEREDPIQALWRTIFVALTEPEGAGNRRRVREVALLAPTEVVARALRRDLRILRGSRRGTTDTYFLKLKPHGQAGSRREAFYLDRRYVERYVRLVSVGP